MDLREELLGAEDLASTEVEVPQWNKTVRIQELGLADSLATFGTIKPDGDGSIRVDARDMARTVVYGTYDPETRERIFKESDIDALVAKNQRAMMFLYTAIVNLGSSVADEVKN